MSSPCKMSMTIIITINGKAPEAHTDTHTHINTQKRQTSCNIKIKLFLGEVSAKKINISSNQILTLSRLC